MLPDPCFKNTLPADCEGLMPTPVKRQAAARQTNIKRRWTRAPSFVMIAELSAGTLNSSAANFNTAVNGAASGTLSTLNGNFGSLVKVILKETLAPEAAGAADMANLTDAVHKCDGVVDVKAQKAEENLSLVMREWGAMGRRWKRRRRSGLMMMRHDQQETSLHLRPPLFGRPSRVPILLTILLPNLYHDFTV
jgi:hypothetical protein